MTVGEHRPSDDGKAYRFIAYTVDIQERKRSEEITASFLERFGSKSSNSDTRQYG